MALVRFLFSAVSRSNHQRAIKQALNDKIERCPNDDRKDSAAIVLTNKVDANRVVSNFKTDTEKSHLN